MHESLALRTSDTMQAGSAVSSGMGFMPMKYNRPFGVRWFFILGNGQGYTGAASAILEGGGEEVD